MQDVFFRLGGVEMGLFLHVGRRKKKPSKLETTMTIHSALVKILKPLKQLNSF